MSRSHLVLVCALLAVMGLVGITRVVGSGDAAAEPAPSTQPAPTVAITAPPTTAAVVPADCTLSTRLAAGDASPEVACLETRLIAAGLLTGTADELFDAATEAAVRSYQQSNSLVVDGVIGPQTARLLGAWAGPDVLPPDPGTCTGDGNSAMVDRFNQRAWLCQDGAITKVMPITSAWSQPDPGTYEVYAKDLNASSTLTGEYSTMTHFVAFTYGKFKGARIAFHSVPKYSDGEYVQPLDSVGTAELQGDSSGCIRVLPDDAELIWDFLDIGDTVTVVS